jgi:hypothetical protein
MRKSRFTESQIVAVLKQGEAGLPVAEILREHGISKATYFQWRAKYAGATIDELKRLRSSKSRTPSSNGCTRSWRWRMRRSKTS